MTADKAILPAGSRVAIIAGSGALPLDIAERLNARGHAPFVLRVSGEADRDFSAFEGDDIQLEAARDLLPMLKRAGATHVVLAGGISRRPDFKAVRFGFVLIPLAMRAAAALLRGDNALLGTLVGFFEARGFKVVGAHQILPELLAPEACLTKRRPSAAEWRSIRAGMEAARAIGALDAGQAVVVIGERAVALEGVEGTAAMIARVRDLKASGRISTRSAGVWSSGRSQGRRCGSTCRQSGRTRFRRQATPGLPAWRWKPAARSCSRRRRRSRAPTKREFSSSGWPRDRRKSDQARSGRR